MKIGRVIPTICIYGHDMGHPQLACSPGCCFNSSTFAQVFLVVNNMCVKSCQGIGAFVSTTIIYYNDIIMYCQSTIYNARQGSRMIINRYDDYYFRFLLIRHSFTKDVKSDIFFLLKLMESSLSRLSSPYADRFDSDDFSITRKSEPGGTSLPCPKRSGRPRSQTPHTIFSLSPQAIISRAICKLVSLACDRSFTTKPSPVRPKWMAASPRKQLGRV